MDSYLKKYAFMYEDVDFTSDEEADIGRFAARMMKLASVDDQDGIVRLFREEFGDIDEETFERLNGYTEWMEIQDKNAAAGGGSGALFWPSLIAALSLGLAATPHLERGVASISRGFELKKSLRTILSDHPELRNDPNVNKYFQAIVDFAPDIAKNPTVTGNLIGEMHRMGPGALTWQTLRDLIGMQAGMPQPTTGVSEMAEPLREFGREMRARKEFIAGGERDTSQRTRAVGEAGFWR